MKIPGVVAVLCVVPSGLVLHIGITSCNFPPWTEMSKKNRYEIGMKSCKRDTKSKRHPSVKLAPVRVFSCKHPLSGLKT